MYEKAGDRIYLYNPYQLAVMAMDNAELQPVLSGDAKAKTFGSGTPVCFLRATKDRTKSCSHWSV